jgi:hypothetical protein
MMLSQRRGARKELLVLLIKFLTVLMYRSIIFKKYISSFTSCLSLCVPRASARDIYLLQIRTNIVNLHIYMF